MTAEQHPLWATPHLPVATTMPMARPWGAQLPGGVGGPTEAALSRIMRPANMREAPPRPVGRWTAQAVSVGSSSGSTSSGGTYMPPPHGAGENEGNGGKRRRKSAPLASHGFSVYPYSDEDVVEPKRHKARQKQGDGLSHGRWTKEEHELFLRGLRLYGREWKKVAADIRTRSSAQIRSHAQKYFAKLAKGRTGMGILEGKLSLSDMEDEGEDDEEPLSFSVPANMPAEDTELYVQVKRMLAQLKRHRGAILDGRPTPPIPPELITGPVRPYVAAPGPSQSTYAPPPHVQPHNIQVDAPTSQPREAARLLGTLISLSEREYSKMQERGQVTARGVQPSPGEGPSAAPPPPPPMHSHSNADAQATQTTDWYGADAEEGGGGGGGPALGSWAMGPPVRAPAPQEGTARIKALQEDERIALAALCSSSSASTTTYSNAAAPGRWALSK